jgi:hypothetical protein
LNAARQFSVVSALIDMTCFLTSRMYYHAAVTFKESLFAPCIVPVQSGPQQAQHFRLQILGSNIIIILNHKIKENFI